MSGQNKPIPSKNKPVPNQNKHLPNPKGKYVINMHIVNKTKSQKNLTQKLN